MLNSSINAAIKYHALFSRGKEPQKREAERGNSENVSAPSALSPGGWSVHHNLARDGYIDIEIGTLE